MENFRYYLQRPCGTACTEMFNAERTGIDRSGAARFGRSAAEKVRAFHRGFPEYCVTPLTSLDCLAEQLGVRGLYVKDESFRFGLNAFKVLGGSYAIGSYIAGKLGKDISELSCAEMLSEDVRNQLGGLTFVTATDGNHGRGVAWTANRLRQKSVVYMPAGTAPERLENIRKLGADASITDINYDDDVRLAAAHAEKYGWVLVQDTSREGYTEIPEKIMQGYTTMALEAVEQLNGAVPTHVFLQAGVGSMAGAVTAFLAEYYGARKPVITIVEPNAADCIFRTAAASDGRIHAVEGRMETMMAGLACGEPCPIAWELLRDCAECFVSMPDSVSALGIRALARPRGSDPAVVSGESGAAGFGAAMTILTDPELEELRKELGLNSDSVILCFSTEGATDRENYRRIVGES